MGIEEYGYIGGADGEDNIGPEGGGDRHGGDARAVGEQRERSSSHLYPKSRKANPEVVWGFRPYQPHHDLRARSLHSAIASTLPTIPFFTGS